MARIHGRNICHACSTGDTSGGPRYHLDKSAKVPNQRPSLFARNHNLPAILCGCGSLAPKFFKRFLFFFPLRNRGGDSFRLVKLSFPSGVIYSLEEVAGTLPIIVPITDEADHAMRRSAIHATEKYFFEESIEVLTERMDSFSTRCFLQNHRLTLLTNR